MPKSHVFNTIKNSHDNMEEWSLFLERGKKDLDISQLIFKNHQDYEIGAYFAQQALEKHLKAYFLRTKVIEKPKDLGHYQIYHILTLVETHFKGIKRSTNKSNPFYLVIEYVTNIITHLKKLFNSIKKNDEKLIHWWKYSIKIEESIDDEDYKKIIDSMSGLSEKLEKSFGNYIEQTFTPEILKQLPDEIRSVAEKMENTSTKLKNKEIILQQELKEFENLVIKIIQLQRQGKIKGNIPIVDLEKLLIVYYVLTNYIDLIMRTHPHNIIGRYPRIIEDGISSTQLYQKHKKGVCNLIMDVRESCNEIEMKIKNN